MELCDYGSIDFINKFNGLKNGDYRTKIDGNTFYIENKVPSKLFTSEWKSVITLPLPGVHMVTLLEILNVWNFGLKYQWIVDELNKELKG